MNNLTTRKIVLGMLMALVLAFSVQGTADAQLTLSKSRGDLQVNRYGSDMEFAFTVSGVPSSRPQINNIDDTRRETITIRVSNIIEVRSDKTYPTTEDFTLEEWYTGDLPLGANEGRLINGTIYVKCRPASAGTFMVTITQTAGNPPVSANLAFTAYAVQKASEVIDLGFGTVRNVTPRTVSTGYPNPTNNYSFDEEVIVTVDGNNSEWAYVDFTVQGGGVIYEDLDRNLQPDPGKSPTTTLTTFTNVNSEAIVRLQMRGRTNVIRASVRNTNLAIPNKTQVITYFYGGITLKKVSGDVQIGTPSTQLADPLILEVQDWNPSSTSGTGIRDQIVEFSATALSLAGFNPHPDNPDLNNDPSTRQSPVEYPSRTIRVKTDSSGQVKVYAVLGNTGTSTFNAVIDTNNDGTYATTGTDDHRASFTATIQAAQAIGSIEKESGDGQTGVPLNRPAPDPLVVIVRDLYGLTLAGEGIEVTFTTDTGLLLGPGTNDPGDLTNGKTSDSRMRHVNTDDTGRASVRYNVGNSLGQETVRATINNGAQHVIFNINGTGSTGGGQQPPPPAATNTITISPSNTTGEPGEEVTINVTASLSNVFVTLGSNDFGATRFSPQSGDTPFTSTLLLPVEEGTHSFFATSGALNDTASVTVESELGTLSITAIGAASAGAQTFSITALDADGARPIAPFTATLSGSGFATRTVEISGGSGNARVALPTAAALYTLTVSATGYEDGTAFVRVAVGGQAAIAPAPAPTPPPADTGGVPDSIEITGPSTRSGTVNQELDTPLIVRVLDDDGDGLEGARVFYRVISGRGRLSARGNGRAIGVVTDSSGYARAVFTPLDGGTITVRANTDDISATVEFTITTGSAPTTRTPGASVTPGTISPVVHVGAASRPPMLWVDGGAIYALVGASPQRFASSVDNALNITVGGGKVYWTEKTGESAGTINSANLNGTGVTELASILAVPMGIAVDVTNSTLYWTNSRGRIQSANLDGSGITNVIPGGLEGAMDIALAGGNAYWTQGGNVRFVNLRGTKQVRNVSTGMDTAGSLAIGGGKVYWTEMTGDGSGTVNSANLNGTGAAQLTSILAVPMGIAVDGSRSKLYWTNSRGRIQSANLDGSGIKNVVSGLGSPGELVLSNSIATPTPPPLPRTTTTASKYDLNSDGTVDNADAALVADAMGTSNTRYDVNGDGTVNFLDLLLVFDNRDAGAAGAPTIVGMKMSAAQIDIIEEQIDLLIATNDRSPAAMRTLVYLQQLLVTARPEKTQLLANYPNPFNPETWIPYELATDTNVRITIYNTQGVVIRSLQFGHQSAGYYVGRDRAAYWDGRNALGEQVASGLYFYQLETDEMSSMRKMVILK